MLNVCEVRPVYTNCDNDKMKRALRDFYNATGIHIQFFDLELQAHGYKIAHNPYCSAIKSAKPGMCKTSDAALIQRCRETREPAMHICHAGLIDIAVPVIYNEMLLGYLVLGQMRRDDDFFAISGYLEKLGLEDSRFREHYLSLPLFDNEKIQSILNLATIVAKYTMLDHMLFPGFNSVMQRAVVFIDENLHLPISVDTIAEGALVSKSTLYKHFKAIWGCTVGEYLMAKRIEKAKKLLLETDWSVQQIAQAVGFSSAAYFTANFKKAKGVPPLRFRKINA